MHATTIPTNNLQYPVNDEALYGTSQREQIGSVVDGVSNEFRERIKHAKAALDKIEQKYLESAAEAKGILSDHVEVCARLNGEVAHIETMIAEIGRQVGDDDIPSPRLTGQNAIDAKWDHDRKLRNEA